MTKAQRRQALLLAHWLGPVACHACGATFPTAQVAKTLEAILRSSSPGLHLSDLRTLCFYCPGYDLQHDGRCDPDVPVTARLYWRYGVDCAHEAHRAPDQTRGGVGQPVSERPELHSGLPSRPESDNPSHSRALPVPHEHQRASPSAPVACERGTLMYELKVVRERRAGYGSLRSIRSSREVYDLFHDRFAHADREEFIVVPLDAKNRVLGFHVVSVGSLTSSLVHPRECFKVAILANAAALILVHNHPSGDPKPSSEDLAITKRLSEIGELMGIRVLDHVVVGDNRYVSFVDDGLLSQGMLRTAA